MDKTLNISQMTLLVFIVNKDKGSDVVRAAEKRGIQGGTVFLGEGTARKGILRTLGLDNVHREVILLIADDKKAREVLEQVTLELQMEKKNKGIGFLLPLKEVLGLQQADKENNEPVERVEKMFQAIFVIVDRGEAEKVNEVAQEAGAQGGTIIHARGAGAYETKTVFHMDIEPEKEILLIISAKEQTKRIVERISEELNIEEPNTGILFITELSEIRGIE